MKTTWPPKRRNSEAERHLLIKGWTNKGFGIWEDSKRPADEDGRRDELPLRDAIHRQNVRDALDVLLPLGFKVVSGSRSGGEYLFVQLLEDPSPLAGQRKQVSIQGALERVEQRRQDVAASKTGSAGDASLGDVATWCSDRLREAAPCVCAIAAWRDAGQPTTLTPGLVELFDRAVVDAALGQLVEAGWLRPAKAPTKGRPKNAFLINPRLSAESNRQKLTDAA